MKFGLYLQDHIVPEWEQYYIQYDELKRMIRVLADVESKTMASSPTLGKIGFSSLTVPPPTNAAAMPLKTGVKATFSRTGEKTEAAGGGAAGSGSDDERVDHDATITHEAFFDFLEKEIQKVHSFTDKKVSEIRTSLAKLNQRLNINANSVAGTEPMAVNEKVKKEVEVIGEMFLKLEKYVNLNYTGFHKILKKHDRWLTNPCRGFYLQRLQAHNWTRGDYSDVMVNMSRIWSCLRGDRAPEANLTEKQDFVRSTTKYWVKDEHISQLKWYVLQHLPVLLQDPSDTTDRRDSQLINSVYLDNATLELYKGRLDKTPGAIAVRFRWYGTGTPETVFVERKTHREAWAMEVSVKERFTVHASEIPAILNNQFDKDAHIQRMRDRGKSEKEIEDWNTLVTEVLQAISSKQLVPTLRTQYMRTAFQIPFDAVVRISLDTNLTMLTETGRLGNMDRWFRDPSKPVPRNEITRFPHAVLEVKLQLKDESQKPQWVSDLIESGMLQEVHKFSKFIHGCAVLLPEEVQAMPYWIDDPSLRDSIIASGSGDILGADGSKGSGANRIYEQLLPNDPKNPRRKAAPTPRRTPEPSFVGNLFGWDAKKEARPLTQVAPPQPEPHRGPDAIPRRGEEGDYFEDEEATSCFGCCDRLCSWSSEATFHSRMAMQKVEPKLFFANERTFLHWLNMAVTLSSLAAAVLAFSSQEAISEVYGIILLPVALMFALYALHTYTWRAAKIRTREQARWDDPMGPVLLASVFTLALTLQLVLKIVHTFKQSQHEVVHDPTILGPA